MKESTFQIILKKCRLFGYGIVTILFCLIIQPIFLPADFPIEGLRQRVNAASVISIDSNKPDPLLEPSQELYRSGNYPAAIKMLEREIVIYRSQGNVLKQAISLSNLALVHQEVGEWEKANREIAESLKLLEDKSLPGRSSILVQTLSIRGQLQFAQGQTESALTTWEQTEQLYTKRGDYVGVTRSRINQSQALRVLGFYLRSKTILEDLGTNLATQEDSENKVVTMRSLAIALAQSGDPTSAITLLNQGLNITDRLKLDNETRSIQLTLGNVWRTNKQIPLAIRYYSQAAKSPVGIVSIQARSNLLSLQIENRQLEAAELLISPIQLQLLTLAPNRSKFNIQINFAESLAKINHREMAARVLADVIQQSQKLNDRRTQSFALGSLGDLYKQQKQWQDAQDATSRALNIITNTNTDDLAYRWYAQLGYILAQQGKDRQAIESYSVAIDTLKLLRKDLVNIDRDVQFSFKESVEPTYRELVSLLLKPSNQTNGQNLERSRNLIEALQVAELDNFFREACLNNEKVIIDDVVDRESPTAAIIYPIILEKELQVIVKIPGQKTLKQHRVSKTKQEVEKVAKDLQDLIQEPDRIKDVKKLSQEIYTWLVAPFENEFNGKVNTLVFVLDGALRNIPMSILHDGKQYLIEKNYAIATNLGLRLQSPKPISKSTLRILAAGLETPAKRLGNFDSLPGVPYQLKAIQETGINLTQLKDEKFTVASFGQEVKNTPYNVIHLATHGQFSSDIKQTFLLASDDKLNVLELDRILRDRAQIQPNPIELLVMSACETAVGDNRATLGLAGVAVKAGAQSTLASLWKVKDNSTAVLMGEFYRELKTGKVSKAEALRRAQVKLLKEYSNYAAPSDWAPFILVGNWL
jgi:CHAT domain-containing protein/tetratricopeptide (TPR) repeat protein